MQSVKYNVYSFLAPLLFFALNCNCLGQSPAAPDTDYVRVTNERAQKIVSNLEIKDSEKEQRVSELVATFYRDLNAIHANRDAKLKAIDPAKNPAPVTSIESPASIRSESDGRQYQLHYAFLAKLATELTSDEVDSIKNGLTYHVVPKTYQQYLMLYPNLTLEQKRTIHSLLLEAREHAMDAGSSEEKHGVFGKYKGRINNYLSAQGFDAKQAERDLKARQDKIKKGE